MILYLRCHRLGDQITTAQILPPEHQADDDPAELAAWCLSGVDAQLPDRIQEGDGLLAGEQFGAGDAPEVAVMALQAAGIAAVVCASVAPAFAEAARQLGLPVVVCPDAARTLPDGALLRLDAARGELEDRAHGRRYHAEPCAPEVLTALRQAHMLARMRRMVEDEGFDG